MSCTEMTLSLGVYVLGVLDPAERAEVDAHLAECALCRAELAELEGLPGLLDQVSLEDLTPEPSLPSEDLFERMAAKARAENVVDLDGRRRRYRRLTAVAAAFVLVVGGVFGGVALFRDHDGDSYSGPVQMSVSLAAQKTGTSYTVSVSGLPIDEHCKLIAVAKDGTRDVAGRWDATYQGQAKETGSTSIPRSDLAKLVLLGTDGEQLAVVNV
jgi:predicted anti-sigma-YlaC factor YlaD